MQSLNSHKTVRTVLDTNYRYSYRYRGKYYKWGTYIFIGIEIDIDSGTGRYRSIDRLISFGFVALIYGQKDLNFLEVNGSKKGRGLKTTTSISTSTSYDRVIVFMMIGRSYDRFSYANNYCISLNCGLSLGGEGGQKMHTWLAKLARFR